MKRKVARLSAVLAASRCWEYAASTTLSPRVQDTKRNGPVPTGWVALVAALPGATIAAVASPRKNGSRLDGCLSAIVTVRSSGVSIDAMLANTRLRLLVLASPALRSNVNLTWADVSGVPSWKLTPGRRVKV